jgi:hypothetical protein
MPLDLNGPRTRADLEQLEREPREKPHELEFEARREGRDAGAKVTYSYVRSWFSLSAWAEWWKDRGAAGGAKGNVKF